MTARILLTSFIALTAAHVAFAQSESSADAAPFIPRWWVGATGARSENVHSMGVELAPARKDSPGDCGCGHFGEGTEGGRQFGAAARFEFLPNLALDVRAVADSRPANYTAQLPPALVLLPGTQEVVTQRISASSEVAYDLFTTDVMITARLPILFGISVSGSAGPSIGFVSDATFSRRQDLEEPANARFNNPDGYPTENNGRRIIYNTDSEIDDASSVRLSAKFGGGLEAEILQIVKVRVGAYYDLGLTRVVPEQDWKINSTIYSAEILIGL